jgi:hypothetical protein
VLALGIAPEAMRPILAKAMDVNIMEIAKAQVIHEFALGDMKLTADDRAALVAVMDRYCQDHCCCEMIGRSDEDCDAIVRRWYLKSHDPQWQREYRDMIGPGLRVVGDLSAIDE